jgi:hypothetical protein
MSYGKTVEQMGIEKGWRQASEGFVLRFLQRHIGEVSEEIRAAVQSLSLDRVTQLGDAMFDFESLDDLILWFHATALPGTKLDYSRAKRDVGKRSEGKRKMPYGATIERMGIEKGREQGLQQGLQLGAVEIVLGLLQLRLGELDQGTYLAVRTLTFKKARELSRVMLDFNSANDLIVWLRDSAAST